MEEINYLTSNLFPYDKSICDDAGPGYAQRHGWTVQSVSVFADLVSRAPTVVDHRIVEEEMAEILRQTQAIKEHPVYIKVVDPCWERIRQPYYHWLLRMARLENVVFLGPYQAVSITKMLWDLGHPEAYLHFPYAYDTQRERPLVMQARSGFLAFSGNTNACYYPERHALRQAIGRHWWSARKVTVLVHPGFPDVGQAAGHDITGEKYLDFLAAHRFMYLDPGRDQLEFLKYSECAYAGCVPVGSPAPTLPAAARPHLQPLHSSSFRSDLRRLAATTATECESIAAAYRAAMKRERDAATLNRQLIEHWQRQRSRLQVYA